MKVRAGFLKRQAKSRNLYLVRLIKKKKENPKKENQKLKRKNYNFIQQKYKRL